MYQTKTIDLLNKFVVLNNDRIEGYGKASGKTDEQELQRSFEEFSKTSQRCKTQLQGEIEKLGGVSIEGTKMSSKLFRIWMGIKSTLTGKNRISVLNSCAFGENKALKTYAKTRRNKTVHLTLEHQKILTNQSALLTMDLEKIILLRKVYKR